jgi:APA family basic amino acid/polyamine antiporter
MYVFLREAYGPLTGFLFGWALFLIVDSGTIATLSVAFSSKYLPYFIKLSPWGTKAAAVLMIALLSAVNYFGVKWGAGLQNILTVIKVGAIVAVCGIVFIFAKGNAANFVSPAPQSFSWDFLGKFGIALVAVLWAYKGWESSTFSVGELKRPERNLPLGLFIGTGVVILLYIAANLAYLYAFPSSELAKSSRVAADAMNVAVGPVGASVIAFIILFSIMGSANGHILTGPRVYFALAKDGLFFKRISAVHPRFLTPYVSTIALGIWSALLSLTGTFEQLATFAVFGMYIFMGLTCGAVIVLRKKRPELPRPYKTWGYPLTPIFFILSALFITVNTLIRQFKYSFAGLLIIALGVPAYLYWRRKKTKDNGK